VRGSLHLVRKLGGPGRLNAVPAGQLIHMLDQISNRCFLVDTGASYHPATSFFFTCLRPKAVWPSWSARSLLGRSPGAASRISIFLEISFGRCSFPHFGVDFLRAHKLLIDPEGHALLDSTGRRLAGQLLHSPPTATVVVGFMQPMVESSSSSAHTAGAARAAALEQPAPEQPAPDQFLSPVSGQPRRRQT
jgi:hypothetical protein